MGRGISGRQRKTVAHQLKEAHPVCTHGDEGVGRFSATPTDIDHGAAECSLPGGLDPDVKVLEFEHVWIEEIRDAESVVNRGAVWNRLGLAFVVRLNLDPPTNP